MACYSAPVRLYTSSSRSPEEVEIRVCRPVKSVSLAREHTSSARASSFLAGVWIWDVRIAVVANLANRSDQEERTNDERQGGLGHRESTGGVQESHARRVAPWRQRGTRSMQAMRLASPSSSIAV